MMILRRVVRKSTWKFSRSFHASQDELLRPIPPDTVTHLQVHGYAVLDDFLPTPTRLALLRETEALLSTSHATANRTHVLRNGEAKALPKGGVRQAEVSTLPAEARERYQGLTALQDGAEIAAQVSVFWPRLTLTAQAVKAQRTEEGGAFPVHVDAADAGRDARVVTALLYPQPWPEEGTAGALRLYPSPLEMVDIAPCEGRLVLLSARLMHHRVLRAPRDRIAVTVWLSGRVSADRSPPLPKKMDARLSRIQRAMLELLAPRFRDVAFKLAMLPEWTRSLRESHACNHAEALVGGLLCDADIIRQRLPSALCAALGRDAAPTVDELRRVVKSNESLRDAFQDVSDACGGGLPFIW